MIRHPLVIAAAVLAVLPWAAQAVGFTWGIANEIALLALAALGFNLLLGYTGLLSFGHGLFFGLGAYGTALAQIHLFPGSVLLPMVFGIALATLTGWGVGFLALRRRGVYFSLLTMAFTALAFYVVYRWTDFTGGENGLSGVQRSTLLGLDLEDNRVFYAVSASVVFAAIVVLWRIVNAPLGTVFQAIREHETRTRFIGYPVMRYRLAAFVLSALFVGLAGAMMVMLKRFVSADLVHVNFSGEILAMTIFGGIGGFLGPGLGAIVYVALREWLSGFTAAWQFWFGLAFMGFILFSPDGLVGIGARIAEMLRRSRQDDTMGRRIQPDPDAALPAFLRTQPVTEGPLLEAGAVSKRFGAFQAVNQVTLRVRDRTLHALIGPNGAGKTTLFNVISGLYPGDGGEIRLGGRAIGGLPERAAAAGVARSFQITSIFPTLTVWENLRLACQARDAGRARWFAPAASLEQVNTGNPELVRFLGLEGLERAPASSLSYGGQRLVEIGLALACKPRLLMLDEPLVGLAAAERERVSGLIRRLSREMGVLLVEHDIDRVFAICDTVTAMNEGTVMCEGTADEVRTHPEVQRVYLGEGAGAAGTPRRAPATDRPPVLSLKGVRACYGKSIILHDVSFDVAEGEVVALLGRNGAGKSTVLKSVLGLLPLGAGTISLADRPLSGLTAEQIARLGIGLVPQGRRLFGGMTVAENLRLGELARRGGAGTRWTRERIFERFPRVAERLGTHADQLSGGEQQMVAIARAMIGDVRVLLMDEPFEGLSPAMVDEVKASVESLRGEVAIVIVEHHLDIVLGLADRAVVLDRGQVLHQGPAEALRADRDLRKRVLWV